MQSVGVFEGYTAHGYVVFPDKEQYEASIYTYTRLRGCKYIVGVLLNGTPIGWVQTRVGETASRIWLYVQRQGGMEMVDLCYLADSGEDEDAVATIVQYLDDIAEEGEQ